jgi:hypothetical protein
MAGELAKALDEAITTHGADAGVVEASAGGASATVELDGAGPIGVRVTRVRVEHGGQRDLADEAAALPDRVRGLPERVVPIEVDPRLGGAVLRSRPEEMEGREFMEIEVDVAGASVRRLRPRDGGGREAVGWDATRRDLGRLVDTLAG